MRFHTRATPKRGERRRGDVCGEDERSDRREEPSFRAKIVAAKSVSETMPVKNGSRMKTQSSA